MGNRSNLWIGSFPRKDGRHFSREEIEDELEKKEGFVLRSMGGESLPSLSIWDIAPDDNAAVMDWVQSKLPAFQPLHDKKRRSTEGRIESYTRGKKRRRRRKPWFQRRHGMGHRGESVTVKMLLVLRLYLQR